MATFVVLASYTDQGMQNVGGTTDRLQAVEEMTRKTGVTIKALYWTLGQYDIIAVCEAPDDETAVALALSAASRGNVRVQTLRAFSVDEMKGILGKLV
jgi:uncharacterized protein with GYD domain